MLFLALFMLHAALPSASGAATTAELSRIKKERLEVERTLTNLKKELDLYQKKLNATKRQETTSVRRLNTLKKKITALGRLIAENQRYLKVLDRDIDRLQGELRENRRAYGGLSSDFARTAVAVYKHGADRDRELFFSAPSVNEAIVRAHYMGFFARAVHGSVDNLQQAAEKIRENQQELERSYRAKAATVRDQERQLKNYAASRSEREAALEKIKKDRAAYTRKVLAARRKRQQLQSRIESLIRAEQQAIEAEAARRRAAAGTPPPSPGTGRTVPPPPDSPELMRISADFDKAIGQLPWPVPNGRVAQRFGSVTDKELKIVTTNNGIDIAVAPGTPVKAVSGGKVARIAFMPTFGNIVIIRHPNSYLTVYANLGELRVAQNELIGSQQLIGLSGKNAEGGSVVHFEIWKGGVKQNPEKWLR